ncbi:MAG: DUF5683 domain-containing protein [Bacteroidota bacterium]
MTSPTATAQAPDSTVQEVDSTIYAGTVEVDPDSLFAEVEGNEEIEFFEEISTLDPNKAAVLSAALPGLGQVYNRQYWKVPIIYGAFLGLFHGIRYNHELYSDFTNALIEQRTNNPTSTLAVNFDETTLTRNRDRFRRDRDFLIILTVAAYMINIVEAHVAAHLHEFQVNESLSLNLEPSFESSPIYSRSMGVSLTLNF